MTRPSTISKWLPSQLMTNVSYQIDYYSDKDFKSVNLHSHDFYELYFFVGGDASYIIESGHYRLNPNDILLIPPQTLHQLDINDSNETYERIVLWINPKFVRHISTKSTDLSYCFSVCADKKDYLIRDYTLSQSLKELLYGLYNLNDNNDFGKDIECENLIREALLSLCKHQKYSQNDGAKQTIAHSNQTVAEIIKYIDEHIAEPLSLDVIAETVYLSKFYISRLFKQETNSTIHQYVLKKRLALSKRYIESGTSIADVCTRCGFLDYSHFFRAFKAEFGLTPKQYYSLVCGNV